MKKDLPVLILLFIMLITLNYSFLDSQLIQLFEENYEVGIVTRVIDGDTVKIGNESIRLLGINSPEKGEQYSQESTTFLENQVLNKEIRIYFGKTKYDRYRRKLGYIFLNNKNINLESVKLGLSNIYFLEGKTKYYEEFKKGWEFCLKENKNLCEESEEKCIFLESWEVDTQKVILQNICSNEINLEGWSIKDEGRKKYVFGEKIINPEDKIEITNEDFNKDYVWTKSGDSIFVRDSFGKLVLWDSY